jgi:hypothetical protein
MATKKKKKKKIAQRAGKKTKTAKLTQKKQVSKKPIAKRRKGTGRRPPAESARTYAHTEGRTFEPEPAGLRNGGQSGDTQGLRDRESADSESVDELLEEGNAFEADVVAGVEHVEDDEEREVHTHEVPEDDVPEEYRDKDS